MRFCATYSDSHRVFLDRFFLKTFPFEHNTSLILERMPQKCPSGWVFADGWRDQMIEKQNFINKILLTSDEVTVFCDVDIAFYGNLIDDLSTCLGGNDIAFMKDHNNSDEFGRCGGFFIVRPNSRTRELFSRVLSELQSFGKESTSFSTSEQRTINAVMLSMPEIKWAYLPPRYYTHGLYIEGLKNFSEEDQSGLWWQHKDEDEKLGVFIPDDMKIHHANWASGVERKLELLEFVYRKRGRKDGK